MATLMRVPEVAAGATEVVLSEWLVDEGGDVQSGAPIVVVETEKAIVEVEAEASGTVLRRLVESGTTVEVGSPLALVGASEEAGDTDSLLAELGVTQSGGKDLEPAQQASEETPAETDPESGAPVAEEPARERIFATPLSRRLLAEAGIDLEEVSGTGPNGRITKRDAVQACRERETSTSTTEPADQPAAQPARAASTPGPSYSEVEHTRLRRAVAARLTTSKHSVPHFYVRRVVRIDALLELRAQLNDVSAQRISVNDLVVRAVATAHQEVPEANVVWTDDAMRQYDSVDVGVAIASERGLVTPVLRGVQNSTPSAIARRVRELVDQANKGKLQQRDLEGGTISVTNLGMYGVDEFSAIINPPQSAILAVGAGKPQPVVADGAVEVATLMNLVLSVDHRAIDGALAARWMTALASVIEQPLRLLA
ncbi:dihydrolipoamide acetyltransferase family protein [Marmoricola sp. URHB0036]|uniref:dihydrolipoamide acetyltransferase family protein n=1 Tax=Marmoricola sp. URHB0036 TaxID=1298863 RepID=UPI00041EA940|nr:dihydrolipoamide acetyltransferase family protein [Marmoricola sp. URHB0036]